MLFLVDKCKYIAVQGECLGCKMSIITIFCNINSGLVSIPDEFNPFVESRDVTISGWQLVARISCNSRVLVSPGLKLQATPFGE